MILDVTIPNKQVVTLIFHRWRYVYGCRSCAISIILSICWHLKRQLYSCTLRVFLFIRPVSLLLCEEKLISCLADICVQFHSFAYVICGYLCLNARQFFDFSFNLLYIVTIQLSGLPFVLDVILNISLNFIFAGRIVTILSRVFAVDLFL